MKPAVKNAVESALVSVAVAVTFLWFLVDASTADQAVDNAAKLSLLSLGLGAACVAHLYFMMQAVILDGRSRMLWATLLIVTFPIASVVLVLKLYLGSTSSAQQASGPARGDA